MQFSTTPTLEGQTITEYCGVVTGEAILGANIFRDFFAGIRAKHAKSPLKSSASRRKPSARMRSWESILTTKRSGKMAAC